MSKSWGFWRNRKRWRFEFWRDRDDQGSLAWVLHFGPFAVYRMKGLP